MLRHAVSEFAPVKIPWKEILVTVSMLSSIAADGRRYLIDKKARSVKISLRVHAERHGLHQFDIDAHSGFESP